MDFAQRFKQIFEDELRNTDIRYIVENRNKLIENDPAVSNIRYDENGDKEWYLNDEELTEQEFNKRLKKLCKK